MDFDFDFDFDLDGLIPALLVGKLVSDALEKRPAPPAPAPASPPPEPQLPCAACQRPHPARFAFCPHCGHSAAVRGECRYCGRELMAGQNACGGCGAPAVKSRR